MRTRSQEAERLRLAQFKRRKSAGESVKVHEAMRRTVVQDCQGCNWNAPARAILPGERPGMRGGGALGESRPTVVAAARRAARDTWGRRSTTAPSFNQTLAKK